MRNRTPHSNPKTNPETLLLARNRHNKAVLLFEKRRDIDGFLAATKEKLKETNSSISQLQKELGLNKKTVYRWFDKSKQPSQALQKQVCEYLNIPYDMIVLTPNEYGEFPCGLRVCSSCSKEFALFKNMNYNNYRCPDCKVGKVDFKSIEVDWQEGLLSVDQLISKLKDETGYTVGKSTVYEYFRKLGISRTKRIKSSPCKA